MSSDRDDPPSGGHSGFEGDRTWVPPELSNAGRLELLIFGSETFVRHPLPDAGTLTLGRSEQADVRVDDPSISRTHALLHISEGEKSGTVFLHIQDLGSSNGTRIRGKRLEDREMAPIVAGEVVDLGLTMLIVQRGATAARPRRLWTHGYFEVRLEEECERAARSGSNFSVIRVAIDEGVQPSKVEEMLTTTIRSFDVLASYVPREYELLLVDTTAMQTEQLIAGLRNRLLEQDIEVDIGFAMFPQDGRGPEALVAKAGARVRGGEVTSNIANIVVVEDGAMQNIYRLIDRVAPSNISVLILGETGVGKEVVAQAVHDRSNRSAKAFLRLNCAALSESLLESELFGHERGAFTGAVQAKPGLLETAEGGTVFLDEVGELPMSTQVKLLRIIEERQVLRVGSLQPRKIDVRFVSATNRDLEAEIGKGSYRKDLFYRLNGISLVIPPLRERAIEIAVLATSFGARALSEFGTPGLPVFDDDAMNLLRTYYWPGNIRELRNVVERAVLLSGGHKIGCEHLPVEKLCASLVSPPVEAGLMHAPVSTSYMKTSVRPDTGERVVHEHLPFSPSDVGERTGSGVAVGNDTLTDGDDVGGLKGELEGLEKRRILQALEKCGGNQTQAAKLLGMSRRTLVSRLDLYKIARPRKNVSL